MRTQCATGVLDVAKIRGAIAQRGRHANHCDVETREVGGVECRQVSGLQCCGDRCIADIAHEALATRKRFDTFDRDVEADNVEPDLYRTHRDGEPDVTLANHDDLCGSFVQLFEKSSHRIQESNGWAAEVNGPSLVRGGNRVRFLRRG